MLIWGLMTSEKAKPAKAGDAKPWVYGPLLENYDRQVAESHKDDLCFPDWL
jgi:hypothetical protein